MEHAAMEHTDNEESGGAADYGAEQVAPTESSSSRKRQMAMMAMDNDDDADDDDDEVDLGDHSSYSLTDLSSKQLLPVGNTIDSVGGMACTLEDFVQNAALQPRPEWLSCKSFSPQHHHHPHHHQHGGRRQSSPPPMYCRPTVAFGKDKDSALSFCIRNGHYDAAKRLVEAGIIVNSQNEKGVTAFILAAQYGNLAMVILLESRGANPWHMSNSGSTAVLQAAHFGHLKVLQYLLLMNRHHLEFANNNETTALMRASQEGHLEVVKLLCQMGAMVNRKNNQRMTSLMLASQRGNAEVCEYLISQGANLNAKTDAVYSTSLTLACKRQHIETVRVLVTAGADLFVRDAKGRTPKEIVLKRHVNNANVAAGGNPTPSTPPEAINTLAFLLDADVQLQLMRCQARKDRVRAWIRLWALLQQDRARLRSVEDVPLHEAVDIVPHRRPLLPSTMAWIRTLALPAPLFQKIAQYCPLPHIWDRRIAMLTGRCNTDPNAALDACFDLIDEILEESGFLRACDEALVPPPIGFPSWTSWKGWCRRNARVIDVTLPSQPHSGPPELGRYSALSRGSAANSQTAVQHRRFAGYLQVLVQHAHTLTPLLIRPPYEMPPLIVQQLITNNDICSLLRRFGANQSCGVTFSSNVATELVLLASQLYNWHSRECPAKRVCNLGEIAMHLQE